MGENFKRVEDLTGLNRVERADRVEDSRAGAPPQTPNASQSPAISPHSGHGAASHLQIIFASFAFFAAKIIPIQINLKFYTIYTFYTPPPTINLKILHDLYVLHGYPPTTNLEVLRDLHILHGYQLHPLPLALHTFTFSNSPIFLSTSHRYHRPCQKFQYNPAQPSRNPPLTK